MPNIDFSWIFIGTTPMYRICFERAVVEVIKSGRGYFVRIVLYIYSEMQLTITFHIVQYN